MMGLVLARLQSIDTRLQNIESLMQQQREEKDKAEEEEVDESHLYSYIN